MTKREMAKLTPMELWGYIRREIDTWREGGVQITDRYGSYVATRAGDMCVFTWKTTCLGASDYRRKCANWLKQKGLKTSQHDAEDRLLLHVFKPEVQP